MEDGNSSSNNTLSAAEKRRQRILANAEKRMNLVQGVVGANSNSTTPTSSDKASKEDTTTTATTPSNNSARWEEKWKEKIEIQETKDLDPLILEGLKVAEELYKENPRAQETLKSVQEESSPEKLEALALKRALEKRLLIKKTLGYYSFHVSTCLVILLLAIITSRYNMRRVFLESSQGGQLSEAEKILRKARGEVSEPLPILRDVVDGDLPFSFLPLNSILLLVVFVRVVLNFIHRLIFGQEFSPNDPPINLVNQLALGMSSNDGQESSSLFSMLSANFPQLKSAKTLWERVSLVFHDGSVFVFFLVTISILEQLSSSAPPIQSYNNNIVESDFQEL